MRPAMLGPAVLLFAGCRHQSSPVPLKGNRGDIARLAGTWIGSYHGTESRRAGSITFTIAANGDSAIGDVLMETPPGLPIIQPADDAVIHRAHAREPRLLAVRFAAIVGGEIEGVLEPYIAPDCKCTVRTTFTGIIRGDTARGTLFTRGANITPQTGEWAVTRGRGI